MTTSVSTPIFLRFSILDLLELMQFSKHHDHDTNRHRDLAFYEGIAYIIEHEATMKRRVSFKLDQLELDLDHSVVEYDRLGIRNLLISARVAESIVEWMVLLGPRAIHELCPDLTLTMAATERTLFSYAETLLMHAGGGKAAGGPGSCTPAVTLHGVAAALERALPAMELDRSFSKPSGGTCSLLFYMVSTLRAVDLALEAHAKELGLVPTSSMQSRLRRRHSSSTSSTHDSHSNYSNQGVSNSSSGSEEPSLPKTTAATTSTTTTVPLAGKPLEVYSTFQRDNRSASLTAAAEMVASAVVMSGAASAAASAAASSNEPNGEVVGAVLRAPTQWAAKAMTNTMEWATGAMPGGSGGSAGITSRNGTSSEWVGHTVRACGIAGLLWKCHSWRKRAVSFKRRKQRLCGSNDALTALLKLWTLVMFIVDAEKVRRVASYHLLSLVPCDEDTDPKQRPSSRTLVELVPMPSSVAFWYEADWAVFAFRRVMDTLYASVATVQPLWDVGGVWVGAPCASVVALYYGLWAPQQASRRACLEMMQPSVRFIRRSWGALSLPAVVGASRLIAQCRGLSFQKVVAIRGVPCFAYAASDPAAKNPRKAKSANQQPLLYRAATRAIGLSHFDDDFDSDSDASGDSDDDDVRADNTRNSSSGRDSTGGSTTSNSSRERTTPSRQKGRNVVLYCHGGAFVASLHAADLYALTDWAIATGSVVLFPDYSLAPDHPYPDGLDQLLDVYLALDARRVYPRVGSQPCTQEEQHTSASYSSSSSTSSSADYSSSSSSTIFSATSSSHSSSTSSSSSSSATSSSSSKCSTRMRSSSSSSSSTSSSSSRRFDELAWLGGPVGRIALVGESAGGNLATALTIRLLLLQDRAAAAAAKRNKSKNSTTTHRRPHYSMNGDGSGNSGSSSRSLPKEAAVDLHNISATPAKSAFSASTSISGSLSDLMQSDSSSMLSSASNSQNVEVASTGLCMDTASVAQSSQLNPETETLEVKESQLGIDEDGPLGHGLMTIPEKVGASGLSLASSSTSCSSGEAALSTPGFEGTQALSGGDPSTAVEEGDAAYGVGLVHIDGRRQSLDPSEVQQLLTPPPTASSWSGNETETIPPDERSHATSARASVDAATAAATENNTEFNHGGHSDAFHEQRRGPLLPDGLVLLYPSLNLSLAPSPSRAIHNFDPVLPIGIMYQVLKLYPSPGSSPCHLDPCCSPAHAPDHLLQRFPPTHLTAGGFDPLLDDAVDFDTRLRRLGVPCSLHVEPSLPHGFIGLVPVSPAAQNALMSTTRFLRAALNHPAAVAPPPGAETSSSWAGLAK